MAVAAKVKVGSTNYPVGSTLYGTCDTAAATAAKVAVVDGFDSNDCLLIGITVHIKFTYANGVASPTLAIKPSSSGTAGTAKSIMKYGTTAPGTAANTSWQAGAVVSFTYDGTYWQMNDHLDNSTYTVNNGTLTIKQNGTSKATFTANQSTAATAELTDEKVKQAMNDTSSSSHKILLSYSAAGTDETDIVYKSTGFTYSPNGHRMSIYHVPSEGHMYYAQYSSSSANLAYDNKSLDISYSDIKFSASSNPDTWDGTNTSLVTAVSSAKNTVKQIETSGTAETYKLLFSESDVVIGTETEQTRKSSKLTFNPDTNTLAINGASVVGTTSNFTTDSKLTFKKTGNTTSAIAFAGSKATYDVIRLIDNTSDAYGNGIAISGGGGQTIIGGGESVDQMLANTTNAGPEDMWIGNDGDVHIFSDLQTGWAARKDFQFTRGGNFFLPTAGNIYFPGGGGMTFQAANSSEGTGDIVYMYSNSKEKARIWADGTFSSFAGPNYRCYNNPSSGTQSVWSGRLAVTSSSDIRLKENVEDTEVDNALDVINQIKIRSFDWKNMDKHQKIGFIADELEEIDASFVDEGSGGYNKFGDINPKSINNFYMLGYIVKAMQEMSEQIDDLKAQNAKLEKEVKALKKK